MSRGNDAIPTWSGFNYQGKIMLFYVLKLINQINKEKDERVYAVNLEEIEDFCILCDSEYISFHQVKAWLSVTKWSSYSTAMDKLFLLQMKDSLSGCRAFSTEKLKNLLAKLGISNFSTDKNKAFNVDGFSKEYEKLMDIIQSKEVPNRIILKDEEIELYKSIHNKYYHNKKPVHTLEQLRSKEQYIAKLFNDKFSLQLSTEKDKLKKLEEDYEKYGIKRDAMLEALKTLVSKYEAASKDYQTQLTNAIKLPLLVYSGRIIQNYPLGLGIRAVVRTNQLVFEAASKNGNDVYNILSTGQLNGLSIAFLLSIKSVYGQADGLDILLIDDPLQTIDDISAISLADLLTQQGIGQIVLSTHEDSKAALLRYKFKKAGLSVLEENMQKLYMETVVVES